ncbi:MAG: ribose 5-phosphate isomerase B [Defluviitaleaceae bacterium]|nr:ribose 5-phosphate isomerase B [Defluviitaleaceae bacterium]
MIALGCDGAGFELMQAIKAHLSQRGVAYKDFGVGSDAPCDYPVYAQMVAKVILSGECEKGIVICGTGIGISIAANRFNGIRCALCHDVFSAKSTRLHNDANMLAMGGRVIGKGLACEIVDAWLDTGFSHEERHARRISMIDN